MAQADLPTGTDVEACGLVGVLVVTEGAIAAPIPAVGEMSSVSAYSESDEAGTELQMSVDSSGELEYYDPHERPEDGPLQACEDPAFDKLPNRMNGGEDFYFNRSTTPNYLDVDAVANALEESIRAWPQQFNDCGMSDLVDVTVQYGGNSEATNSVQDGNFGGSLITYCDDRWRDTTSVLSFGPTPETVGATCRWGTNPAEGADIKLNSNYTWTRFGGSDACENKIDIKSVATHEAGHWWGMGHVDPSVHAKLTMRNGGIVAVRCNEFLRTLGDGDVRGMRSLYP